MMLSDIFTPVSDELYQVRQHVTQQLDAFYAADRSLNYRFNDSCIEESCQELLDLTGQAASNLS